LQIFFFFCPGARARDGNEKIFAHTTLGAELLELPRKKTLSVEAGYGPKIARLRVSVCVRVRARARVYVWLRLIKKEACVFA
jgi:hypothetical protein